MKNNKICPVCGRHEFAIEDFYEICPVCGWEDDVVQRNEPDFDGGANVLSLNDYKRKWESKADNDKH